ncbi:MAG: sugar phosphate isomerase/epimerase [Acidobacteria bacterium]|nr:sugar phosphate isomerase/epimerase [Acidobacteriota bacterium]MBS1867006.1 sugar phosphate isomerase/epimerase [Acidobacteriota bacterium]
MFSEKGATRREFVRTAAIVSAGGLAAVCSGRSLDRSAGEPDGVIRLGIASYTFRNFARAQMLPFLKELEVSDVNLKDTKDHLPMDVQGESAALAGYAASGIRIHAAGTIYFDKDEDSDIRAKFEYAKRAGARVIVAGDPAPATLPRIETFVKEYDIRFAIHNHGPEDKLWASPLDVLKVVKDLDPRIGCCIDVGHTARTGTDVVHAIKEAGPRLFNMHVKDLSDMSAKESQVAVGRGKMPIREIFKTLAAINYKGFVDLEYEINEKDPMPGVIESLAYMRGVINGLEM